MSHVHLVAFIYVHTPCYFIKLIWKGSYDYIIIYTCSCSYFYDALSHPYMKNCTDGSSYQYVIDPYGLYGADIIAEINQVIY